MIAGIDAAGMVRAAAVRSRARPLRRLRPAADGGSFGAPGDGDGQAADEDVGPRAQIADALAIAVATGTPPAAGDEGTGGTVTATTVGRHIAEAADRALAAQARIGAAAVHLLVGPSRTGAE